MGSASHPDKKGEALKQQRFKMLEDIASEMASNDIVFPTSFDIVMKLRDALRDPAVSVERIVGLIRIEPLISTRLILQANAAAQGATRPAVDVAEAIKRLGINAVRNVALAIAVSQLVRAKELVRFRDFSGQLWRHSLHTAAAAETIARELAPRIPPEEAMFAGLVHDLGAFYMLYRAAQYEELRERPDTVRHLIAQWHESIGESLLFAMQVPERVVETLRDHDHPRDRMMQTPRNLSEVVYAANVMAGGTMEWVGDARERLLGELYTALDEPIQARFAELKQDYAV
jgi:HD-like signal output (HDOD) protein